MRKRKCFLTNGRSLLMATLLLWGGEPARGASGDAAGELSQAGVQAAFQILRQDYIRSGELSFESLNRAALAGLMEHLEGGAEVVPLEVDGEVKGEPEVMQAVVAEGIGWLRPVSYRAEEVALMAEGMKGLGKQGCRTLVLDLREPASPGSFEVAAGMLELVVPAGRVLFRLKQAGREEAEVRVSSREPVWEGALVVLVDGGTNNVGEAMAAVLRQEKRALILGERTAGATVRYQTLPLDERFALRYASAELLLAGGESVFQKGLEPDLKVVTPVEARKAAAERMRQGRVKELVHEVAPERFNEAALVARRNPELESYLKRSAGEQLTEDKAPLTDAVLQRAVDLIQARAVLQGAKLSWKEKAGEETLEEIKPPVKAPATEMR